MLIPHWQYVRTEHEASRLLSRIGRLPVVAIDTETTGNRTMLDEIVFWSMSDGKERWCFPRELVWTFAKFLQDPERDLVFHNVNFDRAMFENTGVDLLADTPVTRFRLHDTLVLHALYRSQTVRSRELKVIGPEILCTERGLAPFDMPTFGETFGLTKQEIKKVDLWTVLKQAPIAKTADYASLDAWVTFRIWRRMQRKLQELSVTPLFSRLVGGDREHTYNLWDYYELLEKPMHSVIYEMERSGITLDTDVLDQCAEDFTERMRAVRRSIAKIVGRAVNPNSGGQMRAVFFGPKSTFKLEPTKRTSGGAAGDPKAALDKDVLDELTTKGGEIAEVAKLTRQYRELQKLRGTYAEKLPFLTHSDGRLRTRITQHVTDTGRLSSVDPNLQNIPARSDDGNELRRAFTSAKGKLLLVADYGQLEPRIGAALSRDPGLVRAFLEGIDFHCNTTSLIFKVPYEKIYEAYQKKERREEMSAKEKAWAGKRKVGKETGLAATYGIGPPRLARKLGCTVQEAEGFLDAFQVATPDLQNWLMSRHTLAREHGTIRTPLDLRTLKDNW